MTYPDGSPTSKKFMQYARALLPLVLLASWPFVAFLANNRDQTLRASDVIIPWFAVVAGAIAGTLIFALLLRNRPINRISIVVGVLCAAFFSFGSVAHALILFGVELGTIWLAVWFVIFVLAGWLSWSLANRPASSFVTTVVGLALLAWPALQVATSSIGGVTPRTDLVHSSEQPVVRAAGTNRPNVYWFLLDGYVRDDALRRYFGHDNGPFLKFLTSRGFQVARSALANYDNTTLSLTSTLNTTYQQLPGGDRPYPKVQISNLSGFNPVVRGFDALGYRYLHAPYAGAAKTQC